MKENVITDYIKAQDEVAQKHLWEVYQIIYEAIGKETTQIISYQMPTFKARRNVIHFAAFKNHLGIYPGSIAIEEFKDEFEGYKFAKGTLQIKYNQEVPIKVIKEIALFSYNLNK